jgi:threonine dehydratase
MEYENNLNNKIENKFERVGFKSRKVYDKGYSDAGHPDNELVIYKFKDKFDIKNIRDNNPQIPYFFQLHKILPLETDFSKEEGVFDPKLDKVSVIQANILEKQFFDGEANIYLADTSNRGGTNSLKDPDAIIMMYRLKELGYDSFSLATTGDCGASVCHIGSKLGMNIHLFVPDDCIERWDLLYNEIKEKGLVDESKIKIYNEGKNMHDAFDASVVFAHQMNIPHDYFFNNQLRIEGSKTIHLEVIEQLGKEPDFYFQALGSGTGLFAMYKAAFDLGLKIPQLIGVQPNGCSPMVLANNGKETQNLADTYVMGIGLPNLGPAFPYLRDLDAKFIGVHEGGKKSEKKAIINDINLLKLDGIEDPGLEASLTVAGLRDIKDYIIEKANKEKRTIDIVLGITGKMREGDRKEIYYDR